MKKIINNYSANEFIIDENSEKKNMYILLEGDVEIFTKQENKKIVLGKLKASDHDKPFFGEMALFFDTKRTAYVQAITECRVAVIQNEGDLLLYFSKSPVFAIQCFKELSYRLYNTTKQFKERESYIKYLEMCLGNRDNDKIHPTVSMDNNE